jgi:hypothetical protein
LLDVVVGNFLDSVTEREFDAPLAALLRARGFTDVHVLHGQFEFGKDFIAKALEPPTQYVLQSKAGDTGLPQWTAMRGQIDVLRTNELAHPAFDAALPRIGVLVLTGRLTGGAPLEVQDYARRADERGEARLEVWDREQLIELMARSPAAALADTAEGPLLELLGRIDSHQATDVEIEQYAARWIREDGVAPSVPVEAAIIATRLREAERVDLACMVALGLLRAVWASEHGVEPPADETVAQADLARQMFIAYADELWSSCTDDVLEPRALIGQDTEGIFVTYPVRCLRLVEILGLYALALGDEDRARVGEWVCRFLRQQPGAAHPISDRWAISLLPALIAVGRDAQAQREEHLRDVVQWLGDRHDNENLGLAPTDASPDDEAEYLLGGALEHVAREQRRSSYLATVILDLAAAFELPELYDLAYNDIAAVGVTPLVPLPNDDVDQYLGGNADVPVDTSPRYAETWADGEGGVVAAHQGEATERYYLVRIGRAWDQLAMSVLLRDRHSMSAIRTLTG